MRDKTWLFKNGLDDDATALARHRLIGVFAAQPAQYTYAFIEIDHSNS